MITRRTVLAGAAATGALAMAGGYARTRLDTADPVLPSAPAGDERLEQRTSQARGRTVDFYTAVPDGHGDGRGLPVCLVLHGGSKTAADFPALGLGKFLTDSVRRGNAPFVLAGASGGRLAWRTSGPDDPQRMVHEEIPRWCADRGFATGSFAALGWSMGGYGALLLAEAFPDFLTSVAALSPAIAPGDPVFAEVALLQRLPIGLWCGIDDGLLDNVRAFDELLPQTTGIYSSGRHNFAYWSTCIPAAFDLIAQSLPSPA
ncbi:alpha/beta hydrolase-fold protein [Actinoplanes sp. N902-109]|uniref:alpha/beta hydrolase-fold protein n=1 Tax=Actinoplanes sp. (strain N902-109) TaxID=649831 RepID=UPI000329503D|nr:alpha/beta hydrolase-fold protein [Actinoplanes sp. N902-109]AGL17901.1 esterase [Actinoplanes sp. N902-109]